MSVDETINELLVKLFKDLLTIEGKALTNDEFKDISYNDMHIIEAVGIDAPRKMSDIARLMSVTTGTLTKAIDALEKKCYVVRIRDTEDKRVIKVSLTDKGRSAYYHHESFHRQMIEHMKDGLSEQELTTVAKSLAKMVAYFKLLEQADLENDGFIAWSQVKE